MPVEFDGLSTDPSNGLVFGALSDLRPTCSCHRHLSCAFQHSRKRTQVHFERAGRATRSRNHFGQQKVALTRDNRCFSMDSALRRRRSGVAFD